MQDWRKAEQHNHPAVDPATEWNGLPEAPAPDTVAVRRCADHFVVGTALNSCDAEGMVYPWTWGVLWQLCQHCYASAERGAVLQQPTDGPLLTLAAVCLKPWVVVALSLPWEGGCHLG